jgi:transcriptional regulator with XRE-family HTH domain
MQPLLHRGQPLLHPATLMHSERLARSLTLPRLAEIVECDMSSLYGYEYGPKHRPGPPLRRRIEAYFGRSIDELLTPCA